MVQEKCYFILTVFNYQLHMVQMTQKKNLDHKDSNLSKSFIHNQKLLNLFLFISMKFLYKGRPTVLLMFSLDIHLTLIYHHHHHHHSCTLFNEASQEKPNLFQKVRA